MARCSNPVINDYLYAVYDNLNVSNIKVFRSYKKKFRSSVRKCPSIKSHYVSPPYLRAH